MVLLTAGLGQLLKRYLRHAERALPRRPPLALTRVEDLSVFPGKYRASRFPRVDLSRDISGVTK